MPTLTLRARLRIAFATLAALLLLVVITAGLTERSERGDFNRFVTQSAVRLALAHDILDASNARAIAARNIVLANTPEGIAQEKAAAVRAHEAVTLAHRRLAELAQNADSVSKQEAAQIAALGEIEARYSKVALDIVEVGARGDHDEATRKMNESCRPLLAQLVQTTTAYITDGQAQAQAQIHEAEAAAVRNQWLLGGIGLLALGACAYLAWSLPAAIVTPLQEAVRVAKAVAAGDLSVRVNTASQDEVGELMRALSAMNLGLVEIVHRVRHGSDSIATGSTQIASGNSDLSHRTEEQSSSLQQTASAMEQMTASVQHSVQTATQAKDYATEAGQSARRGGEVVGQVITTMSDIADSSKKISEIIGTIDGIAFQTNILALNAAVEAARAGEQGRGFAVVASEVRSLAQRSADAAKQIRQLIAASAKRVDAGSQYVAEAGAAMHDIVTQVERVSDLIQVISHASVEQSEGIGQVNQAVGLLDRSTQQNAALVEQSAAAAESLRQQAQGLTEAVGMFKL
jgi:methyl-accepting chemotaxis protein